MSLFQEKLGNLFDKTQAVWRYLCIYLKMLKTMADIGVHLVEVFGLWNSRMVTSIRKCHQNLHWQIGESQIGKKSNFESNFFHIFNVWVISAKNFIFSAATHSVTFWPCGLHSIHRLMQRQQQDELPLLLDQLMSTVKGTKFRIQRECKYRGDKNQSAGKLQGRGAQKWQEWCHWFC